MSYTRTAGKRFNRRYTITMSSVRELKLPRKESLKKIKLERQPRSHDFFPFFEFGEAGKSLSASPNFKKGKKSWERGCLSESRTHDPGIPLPCSYQLSYQDNRELVGLSVR